MKQTNLGKWSADARIEAFADNVSVLKYVALETTLVFAINYSRGDEPKFGNGGAFVEGEPVVGIIPECPSGAAVSLRYLFLKLGGIGFFGINGVAIEVALIV